MNEVEKQFRAALGPEYDHSAKPTVYFFDNAVQVESPDRPRFKNCVYISKTSKTSVGTQDFHRKAGDEDKAEFPAEWNHYLLVRDNLKKPRIGLLPGIDQAIMHEMKALDIYSLEQLLAQEHFDDWKQLARRILSASENQDKGQQKVQGDDSQQPERVLGVSGAGGKRATYPTDEKESQEKNGQKEGYQESQPQEITFSYEIAQ